MAHELDCECDICYTRKYMESIRRKGVRTSILPDAEKAVHGDRDKDYGTPTENWTRTAKIWSVILGVEVTPEQAALCMIGTKIARQVHKPKRDNMVDIAGYAEVVQWIMDEAQNG